MGILDEAIREMRREKQAAEDDAQRALEDFDIITSRAVDAVKKTYTDLRAELEAASWWIDDLSEETQKPEFLSLSFSVRRHAVAAESVANPDYVYAIRFDALGGAVRTTGEHDPLLETFEFRAVARQEFRADLEKDLRLFLKAILYRH